MHTSLLSLFAICCLATQVAAYGAAGHEIVADIAQMYLFPSTREALCDILPPYADCQLGPVAAWADKIKGRVRWANSLHYVNGVGDHPSNKCVFGEEGWQGQPGINLLGGIRNTTDWMLDGKDGAEEALKFFVHFMGDMHMPLHLTGRNKGGNNDIVRWNGRQAKFHAVWDGLIIAKEIRETPYKYTRPLPQPEIEGALRGAIYDPYIRQIVWEGLLDEWADEVQSWAACPESPLDVLFDSDVESTDESITDSDQLILSASRPPRRRPTPKPKPAPVPQRPTDDSVVCPFHWAKPIHAMNCDFVWPPEMDSDPHPAVELDTLEYSGKIKEEKILKKLLAQGGIRLAAVLNSVYGDVQDLMDSPYGRVPDLRASGWVFI